MLMPDYLRHVHRAGIQRYLATGQPHISWKAVQLPGRHQSGREIPLELSFGEFSENGRRFFTGIARDITERRRLERRLDAQLQVARILAASDSMAAAAPALLQAIGESVGWEMGQMWSVDRAAEVLRYLAVWRLPSVAAAELACVLRALDRTTELKKRPLKAQAALNVSFCRRQKKFAAEAGFENSPIG